MSDARTSKECVDRVVDRHGWKQVDEVLPANRALVLIWNDDQKSVQFAEFNMYSAKRYEFMQGCDALSIHDVTHWQYPPECPDGVEPIHV